jgi:signal transduction histidine kinase
MDSPGIHLKGSDVPWFARRKDGLAVPVETAVNVTLIGGKKRLVYAIRDVTERHHFNDAEESCSLAGELSAAYARLRLFVRHAPAAIAMLNTEMRYISVSDSFERAEGGVEHLRWEIMPWKNAAGAIGGMMIFSEVVTEKVRAEAEVRRYQNELEERVRERTSEVERVSAAKSRFLAAASHDLRQPLQAAMPTGA